MSHSNLPRFASNESNRKFNTTLSVLDIEMYSCQPFVSEALETFARESAAGSIRVLDFGCGNGAMVGLLERQGFRAFGVDIEPVYITNALGLLAGEREGYPKVSLLNPTGRSLFPDTFFDIVLTDQVFEHVADLRSVAVELARITRPGGMGIHIFPARFSPVEPHMRLPFVHWLPKGRARKTVIGTMLAAGLGAKYFADLPLVERATIYASFSDEETFYRPYKEVRAVLEENGFCVTDATKHRFNARGGASVRLFQARGLADLAAWAYTNFVTTSLTTRRR